MVMIESAAPDPLDAIFLDFEKRSGWTLSQEAKNILKEGLEALHVDTLGLGTFAMAADRSPIVVQVMGALPTFLFDLAKKADGRPKIETSKRTIGGVFVLQNMGLWQSLSGCTCWPI
ncbi:hypothetical protein XH98_13880 [Bradyrhizobium sp. CCBAU 51745]|uniref:hypothetical protein n=1 Tax=Bradyrhizobium sp. CCBAU 51745 TaxID=1325099 RepID=UPI0023064B4A|nr:hypothetical protein [Bradyrhizobium sp. CCBAU 51745]MDA9440192.1 hypothetical protein [Bradyrhizobium sp. CCBAU 51745]